MQDITTVETFNSEIETANTWGDAHAICKRMTSGCLRMVVVGYGEAERFNLLSMRHEFLLSVFRTEEQSREAESQFQAR